MLFKSTCCKRTNQPKREIVSLLLRIPMEFSRKKNVGYIVEVKIFEVDHLDFRSILSRLARIAILGKEREPRVGKLGWHGNFDTGFERNTRVRVS